MNHGVSGCDVSIEEVACASHSSEARRRGGGERRGGGRGKMAGKRKTKRDGQEVRASTHTAGPSNDVRRTRCFVADADGGGENLLMFTAHMIAGRRGEWVNNTEILL